MSKPIRLLIVRDPVSGPSTRDAQALISGVLSAWPQASNELETREVTLPEAASSSFNPSKVDAALVLVNADSAGRMLFELAERLQDASLAAVVCADVPERVGRMAPEDSWIVFPQGTSPSIIAASLHAVVRRQHAIRRVSRDLSIAMRSNSGMTSEFDKLGEELRLASRLQKELVPDGPLSSNWLDSAVMFRPASFVSGDIYDLRQIDEDRVSFFVADAVGHGVPAALLTMVISRALKLEGRAGELVAPLDIAAKRLNNELIKLSGTTGRFATAVAGVIDRKQETLQVVNAGHPPPLLCRDGKVEEIDVTGPLLGVFPDGEFHVETLEFPSDATLVVYSDGFETVFGELGEHGRRRPTKRHLDFLTHVATAPSEMLGAIADLENAIDTTAGSLVQDDDLTALAIRRAA